MHCRASANIRVRCQMAVTFPPEPGEQQHCLGRVFSLKDPTVVQVTKVLFVSE